METNHGSERLRTYGHLINIKTGYDNIVLNSISKFYLENRTQISASIVRGWGIGNDRTRRGGGGVIESNLL